MRPRPFALLGLLALISVPLLAQDPEQIAVDEILRRGDLVTHTGDFQSDELGVFGELLAPPADDSHKWFIVIFTGKNCASCDKLKSDWSKSQHLQAWAKPGDPKNSWAHFTEFRSHDGTQRWRFERYRVNSLPTIVIQPPRNREYGEPSTVVFQQSGYDGDPEKLSQKMGSALRDYVTKLKRGSGPSGSGTGASGFGQVAAATNSSSNKQPPDYQDYAPPFNVPPRDNPPFYPSGPPLQIPPPAPPVVESIGPVLKGVIAAVAVFFAMIVFLLISVVIYRAVRRALDVASVLQATAAAITGPTPVSGRGAKGRSNE